MGIDKDLYSKPALRGDITGIAIHTSGALLAIARALEMVAAGPPDDVKGAVEHGQNLAMLVAEVKDVALKLEAIFDRLSGWTPEA